VNFLSIDKKHIIEGVAKGCKYTVGMLGLVPGIKDCSESGYCVLLKIYEVELKNPLYRAMFIAAIEGNTLCKNRTVVAESLRREKEPV